MYKELVISIIIIVMIFSLDYALQKYTDNSIDNTSKSLEELKIQIGERKLDQKQIENSTNELYKKWMEYHDKLAFYIEHDELEKVETNFTAGKCFVENKQYGDAIAEFDKTIFVLDHIKDKYSLSIENIF